MARPRGELTNALITLAKDLEKQAAKSKGKGLKVALNNVPPDIDLRKLCVRIHLLRLVGHLPENVRPVIRTVKNPVTGENKKHLYLVYYKKVPRIRDDQFKGYL